MKLNWKVLLSSFFIFAFSFGFCVNRVEIKAESSLEAVDKSWRNDVKFELSDSGNGSKKCEKKLKIFGIPEDIVVDWIRIWPAGCSQSGSSCFINLDADKAKQEIFYDEQEGCYWCVFDPIVDGKGNKAIEQLAKLNMNSFKAYIFLKEKNNAGSSNIEPIFVGEREIFNEGMSKPEHLADLENFKIEFFAGVGNSGGSGILRIHGIPSNVDKICVAIEEMAENPDKNPADVEAKPSKVSINQVGDIEVKRSDDGIFYVNFKFNQATNDMFADIRFKDEDGFSYLICDHAS